MNPLTTAAKSIATFEQENADLRAQLAACQSREAKALEALRYYRTADFLTTEQQQPAEDALCTHTPTLTKNENSVAKNGGSVEADRDQLQAQVGHMQGLIKSARYFLVGDGDKPVENIDGAYHNAFHAAKCLKAALAQPPAAPDSAKDGISCPWCKESDFDLIGLKGHLANGWCEPYAAMAATPPKDET